MDTFWGYLFNLLSCSEIAYCPQVGYGSHVYSTWPQSVGQRILDQERISFKLGWLELYSPGNLELILSNYNSAGLVTWSEEE